MECLSVSSPTCWILLDPLSDTVTCKSIEHLSTNEPSDPRSASSLLHSLHNYVSGGLTGQCHLSNYFLNSPVDRWDRHLRLYSPSCGHAASGLSETLLSLQFEIEPLLFDLHKRASLRRHRIHSIAYVLPLPYLFFSSNPSAGSLKDDVFPLFDLI